MSGWDDYRYVLAVAREGTIVKAAEKLQVTSTTVSRRIRAIEEALHAQLFKKLNHGAVLTPVGEELVEAAEEMETIAAQMDARIQGLDRRYEGVVKLTAGDFIFDLSRSFPIFSWSWARLIGRSTSVDGRPMSPFAWRRRRRLISWVESTPKSCMRFTVRLDCWLASARM